MTTRNALPLGEPGQDVLSGTSPAMTVEPDLPRRPAHYVHQLGDLAPLIGLVATFDRMIDTVRHVIEKDFLLGATQRSPDGADLGHDIDAIPVVFDHAGEPPHLSLDALEPLESCCLAVLCHAGYIPPGGMID